MLKLMSTLTGMTDGYPNLSVLMKREASWGASV